MRLSFILIAVFFFSCKSKKETEKESISRTLKIYLSAQLKDIDLTSNLDSLRIIHIDSVSTKDEFKLKIMSLEDSFNDLIEKSQSANKIFKLSVEQFNTLRASLISQFFRMRFSYRLFLMI